MSQAHHLDLDGALGERRRAARLELTAAMQALSSAERDDRDLAATADLPAEAFTDPRLFSQLGQAGLFEHFTLAQLTLAEAPRDGRVVPVRPLADGVVVLPGVGEVRVGPTGDCVDLSLAPDGTSALVAGERHAVEPARCVPGTRVELVHRIDPVLRAFLDHHVGPEGETTVVDAREHADVVTAAFELLVRVAADYHRLLVDSLRGVVLYRHADAESFAALAMHGYLFVNLGTDPSVEPSVDLLVEEVTHQGGHVVLSEMTLHRQDFFTVDPDARLGDFVDDPEDTRDLYGFLHGLFTEHMECAVVRAVLDADLAGDERPRFEAHLDSVSRRHARDMAVMAGIADDVLAAPGHDLVDRMAQVLAHA